MYGKLLIAVGAAMLVASPSYAAAARCHGPNGKFIKCPPAKPAPAARCRNAQGHFAKCGTPGTHPA
jgi:hypothetical protein